MTKRAVFLFLLGVLCVSTALAGTKRQVIYNLDGKTAGANFYTSLPGLTGSSLNFYLTPAPLPDGSWGYEANINWYEGTGCTPAGTDTCYHEIYGQLPASAVSAKGLQGPITVNITNDTFYIVPGSPFGDDGAFISFEGTFTAYTGPGSGSGGASGRNYATQIHLDGSTETQSFNGTGKGQSAAFEGTFVSSTPNGTYDISLPGASNSSSFFVQVGTMQDIMTAP
jgi:hypothetical protein